MRDQITEQTQLGAVVGDSSAKKLARELKVSTVGELLHRFPRDYMDVNGSSSFADFVESEQVTFIAEVVSSQHRSMRNRRGFLVELVTVDASGDTLQLTFFMGYAARAYLQPGVRAVFHGKVGSYRGQLTVTNPQFALLGSDDTDSGGSEAQADVDILISAESGAPLPVYRGTSKLTSWQIQSSIWTVLDICDEDTFSDPIPADLQDDVVPLSSAYRAVHRPASIAEAQDGLARFRHQEALILQGSLWQRRQEQSTREASPLPARPDGVLAAFDAAQHLILTEGQHECAALIATDMAAASPMNRLLQGEVGSGKTLVALRAMLQAVDAGAQAVLIAPTEVLARQHEASLRNSLGSLVLDAHAPAWSTEQGVRMQFLSGSASASQRQRALLDIASGAADITVGTHALLSDQVQFAQLGLVVVDEQHRFGVDQRHALKDRQAVAPHMLVMSATPIPRSVAMTVFGDLELTVLRGLPKGRQPIDTHVVALGSTPQWIERVWQRVAEHAAAGQQVFVVCPRINDDADSTASVELITERLRHHPLLAQLRIAGLHGQLNAEDTVEIMDQFSNAELDVLVSTTVIEVGVDIPGANLMVILDAESFGVSTLHQLRGRIGRGTTSENICLLVTRRATGDPVVTRLHEVAATSDGMELARLDLGRRKEGDVLGAAQSGRTSQLVHLDILRDEDVITAAAATVEERIPTLEDWQQVPEFAEAVAQWRNEHEEAPDFAQRS